MRFFVVVSAHDVMSHRLLNPCSVFMKSNSVVGCTSCVLLYLRTTKRSTFCSKAPLPPVLSTLQSRRHGKIYLHLVSNAGEWRANTRHGRGAAEFRDGSRFRGQWESDMWLQSEADPRLSRLGGSGLRRAAVGVPAMVMIEVHGLHNLMYT